MSTGPNIDGSGALAVIIRKGEGGIGANYAYIVRYSSNDVGGDLAELCGHDKLWSRDFPECRLFIRSISPAKSCSSFMVYSYVGVIKKTGGNVDYRWVSLDLKSGELINIPSLRFYQENSLVLGDLTADFILWYPDSMTAVFTNNIESEKNSSGKHRICYKRSSQSATIQNGSNEAASELELKFLKWVSDKNK